MPTSIILQDGQTVKGGSWIQLTRSARPTERAYRLTATEPGQAPDMGARCIHNNRVVVAGASFDCTDVLCTRSATIGVFDTDLGARVSFYRTPQLMAGSYLRIRGGSLFEPPQRVRGAVATAKTLLTPGEHDIGTRLCLLLQKGDFWASTTARLGDALASPKHYRSMGSSGRLCYVAQSWFAKITSDWVYYRIRGGSWQTLERVSRSCCPAELPLQAPDIDTGGRLVRWS
jgi:hypothetical protein